MCKLSKEGVVFAVVCFDLSVTENYKSSIKTITKTLMIPVKYDVLRDLHSRFKFFVLPSKTIFFLQEINIEISTEEDSYKPGHTLAGEIKIQNTCGETRTMTMFWRVFVVRYDGVVIKLIKKEKNKVTVKPNDSKYRQ